MPLNGKKHHVKQKWMEDGNQVSKPTSQKKMECYIDHVSQPNIENSWHKVCLKKDNEVGKQTS